MFCRIDRDIIFFPECPKSLYMIRMFMCDKNRIYFPGLYPDFRKPRLNPFCADSHIHKHMRIFLPDIDTVPTAATGNTAQAHSFSLISTSYAEKRAVKTVPFRDQFSLSSEIILTFEL